MDGTPWRPSQSVSKSSRAAALPYTKRGSGPRLQWMEGGWLGVNCGLARPKSPAQAPFPSQAKEAGISTRFSVLKFPWGLSRVVAKERKGSIPQPLGGCGGVNPIWDQRPDGGVSQDVWDCYSNSGGGVA